MKTLFSILVLMTVFLCNAINVYSLGCDIDNVVLGKSPDWIYEADVVNTVVGDDIVVCIYQKVYYGELSGKNCSANDCLLECSISRIECVTIPDGEFLHIYIPCSPPPNAECRRYEINVNTCNSTPECTLTLGCRYDSTCIGM